VVGARKFWDGVGASSMSRGVIRITIGRVLTLNTQRGAIISVVAGAPLAEETRGPAMGIPKAGDRWVIAR
jgi:hypothetical protein